MTKNTDNLFQGIAPVYLDLLKAHIRKDPSLKYFHMDYFSAGSIYGVPVSKTPEGSIVVPANPAFVNFPTKPIVNFSETDSFPAPHVPNINSNLCDTVTHALDSTDFSPSEHPRVLSIGTGPSGYSEYFAFKLYFGSKGKILAQYTAIDRSESNLKNTRREFETADLDVDIIGDDARKIETLVKDSYDVVIIRNPSCETSGDGKFAACGGDPKIVWTEIFTNLKHRIKNDSRLIITHFSEHGFNTTKDLLSLCGYNFQSVGLNPHPGKEFLENTAFDKYLIVAKK